MQDEDQSTKVTNVSSKKVFVGNISYRVSWKQLFTFFKKFGRVRECHLPKDHIKGLAKGFAFVTFWNKAGAQKALDATEEDLTLDYRIMRVHPSEESKRSAFKVYDPIPVFNQQCLHGSSKEYDVVSESPQCALEDEDEWSEFNGVELAETVDLYDLDQVAQLNSRLTELQEQRLKDEDDAENDKCYDMGVNSLHSEVLVQIFCYLPVKDRVRVERVCHRWRRAALDSWRRQEVLKFHNMFKRFGALTDRMLNSLLLRCGKYLKCLDLSASPRLVTDYGVELIGKHCPRLEQLNLSGVDATNTAIKNLASGCSKLKEVYLKSCFHVGEKGLWWLFHTCKDLEVIDLQMNTRISGQCFHMLGSSLRKVFLNGCSKITDVAVTKLAEKCSNLELLSAQACLQMTDASLSVLSTKFDKLYEVDLSGSHSEVSSSGLCLLGNITSLIELRLRNSLNVTDDVIIAVSQGCIFLEVLDISLCHRYVTDYGLTALARIDKLHTLNISYLYQIYCASIIQIALNGRLKKFIARGCSNIGDKSMKVLAEQCFELCEVDLCGILNISNETLKAFCLLHQQDTGDKLNLNLGGTSVEPEKATIPETINLCMEDLSQYHLRADRELILPSEEDEEDDCPEIREFDDCSDEDGGYLMNDDPLEEERWNLS